MNILAVGAHSDDFVNFFDYTHQDHRPADL